MCSIHCSINSFSDRLMLHYSAISQEIIDTEIWPTSQFLMTFLNLNINLLLSHYFGKHNVLLTKQLKLWFTVSYMSYKEVNFIETFLVAYLWCSDDFIDMPFKFTLLALVRPCNLLWPTPVSLYGWERKVTDNERRHWRYICNVLSHWLSFCPILDRNRLRWCHMMSWHFFLCHQIIIWWCLNLLPTMIYILVLYTRYNAW